MDESPPARILIVCTANAIRSPFVEYLLRARLAEAGVDATSIESAGTAARPGAHAEPRVVELGRQWGLDLGDHRSRRLDEAMLQEGTIVLCAAAAHRRVVMDMRPQLLDTTFTIRELARLLTDAPRPVGAIGSWESLARSAARRRTTTRRASVEIDDLVDPIGQSPGVWEDFARDAVAAVDTIAARAASLVRRGVDRARPSEAPRTRRELRALRASVRAGVSP